MKSQPYLSLCFSFRLLLNCSDNFLSDKPIMLLVNLCSRLISIKSVNTFRNFLFNVLILFSIIGVEIMWYSYFLEFSQIHVKYASYVRPSQRPCSVAHRENIHLWKKCKRKQRARVISTNLRVSAFPGVVVLCVNDMIGN